VTGSDYPPARRVLGKWQYVYASPAADDEHSLAHKVYRRITLRRCPRRRLSRGGAALVGMLAVLMALVGCGSNSHKPPDSAAATTAPTTSTVTQTTTAPTATYTTLSAVGQQAFLSYQQAFGVIAEISGTPTARSTDPRLSEVLIDPFYSEVVQEINVYRLRDEVVRGSYSFANIHLDTVTTDGRVIFTDCQTNSQAVYSAKTGALVGDAGTSHIPEQIVAFRSSPSAGFKIADDNQGPAVTAARDACAP
jgi:hypothetical protein